MIYNIVDCRKNPYRWYKVWGVVEPTFHDNIVKNASQAAIDAAAPDVEYSRPDTFCNVLKWADRFSHAMTLYVYGSDPMCVARRRQKPVDSTIKAGDPA